MYDLDIYPDVDKIFVKLANKNPKQLGIIWKKIQDIRVRPDHKYKFLKKPLQSFNRVHIDKHFVLIFKIFHAHKVVEIFHYGHHDNVYLWSPRSEAR